MCDTIRIFAKNLDVLILFFSCKCHSAGVWMTCTHKKVVKKRRHLTALNDANINQQCLGQRVGIRDDIGYHMLTGIHSS